MMAGFQKWQPVKLYQNYYDNYNFDKGGLNTPSTVYEETINDRPQSLATGSKIKVLDTNNWITSVTYYDKKARPIYIASKNEHLHTIDITENKLDFIGRLEETKITHTKDSNTPIVTIDSFTYDHMGRLLTQIQTINDSDGEIISSNEYDELGQLISKRVGGSVNQTGNGLQEVDYTYNVRGWLKGINDINNLTDHLFSFQINYTLPTQKPDAVALYNGNISEIIWKTANDNVLRSYTYHYDALNRITKADSGDDRYTVSGIVYDKAGNIEQLTRYGHINDQASAFGLMDNLFYNYNAGNQLQQVFDLGDTNYGYKTNNDQQEDYRYDANGNMIMDFNKNITGIVYNHLNLPTRVNVDSARKYIRYIYDATGVKLQKIITENGTRTSNTIYAGNYIYNNGDLEFFNHPEGYIEPSTTGFDYIYQYKDHLGNIRLSYKDADKDGTITQDEIIEENNYYPFGLEHKGYNNIVSPNGNSTAQKFKYNGKELEEELGKNTYSYGWRDYDPAIGRFNKIDRYSEKYYGLSPYNYTANDPVSMVDIAGDSISVSFLDQDGNKLSKVPLVVQRMFNREYGIKVGYNSDTEMLYYDGEIDTNNKVSKSAKDIIVGALKETDSKKTKGFGSITFGYNLKNPNGGINSDVNGGGTHAYRDAYIDLSDFNGTGRQKGYDYKNVPVRALNLGRVFEHEWIGHVLNKTGDRDGLRRFDINPGGAASVVNEFRREMGLPIRLNYGTTNVYTGTMFFGSNTLSVKSARATAKSYLRRLEKYSLTQKGSLNDIPAIKPF